MGVITLREYAENNGISYEAVRRQVIRHKKELGKHLTKEKGTQYLDETAQAILDKHRSSNPTVIMERRIDNDYRELSQQIMQKDAQIQALQAQLLQAQAEATKLIEYKTKVELLAESRDELKDRNKQLEDDNRELTSKLEVANYELNTFKPSILGFYRKK